MVTLPENLTATKYPGYFWDVNEHVLYSLKVGGVLKPLKRRDVRYLARHVMWAWRLDCDQFYWQISVDGRKRIFTDKYLKGLKLEDSEIPVKQLELFPQG